MKNTQKKTDVLDLARAIDAEFSAREVSQNRRDEELQVIQDRTAKERTEVEATQVELAKEKAGFDVLNEEVNAKLAKIRSDEKLSEDLRTQALTDKDIDIKLKDAKEERGLAEILLAEVAKREAKVSEREKNYKEELKKEFAASIFKG